MSSLPSPFRAHRPSWWPRKRYRLDSSSSGHIGALDCGRFRPADQCAGASKRRPRDEDDMSETSGSEGAMRVDTDMVQTLATLLSDNGLSEIEVVDGERRITVRRSV